MSGAQAPCAGTTRVAALAIESTSSVAMVRETVVCVRPRTVFTVALCVLAVVIFVQVVLVSAREGNPKPSPRRMGTATRPRPARGGARHYLDAR
jgi:hypothetical protein